MELKEYENAKIAAMDVAHKENESLALKKLHVSIAKLAHKAHGGKSSNVAEFEAEVRIILGEKATTNQRD